MLYERTIMNASAHLLNQHKIQTASFYWATVYKLARVLLLFIESNAYDTVTRQQY